MPNRSTPIAIESTQTTLYRPQNSAHFRSYETVDPTYGKPCASLKPRRTPPKKGAAIDRDDGHQPANRVFRAVHMRRVWGAHICVVQNVRCRIRVRTRSQVRELMTY